MSFILDALRRADAQRERDASRGIHAQAGPLPGAGSPSHRARLPLGWAIAALAGVAAAGVALQWHSIPRDRASLLAVAPAGKGGVPASADPTPVVPVAQPLAPVAAAVRPAESITPPAPPPAAAAASSQAAAPSAAAAAIAAALPAAARAPAGKQPPAPTSRAAQTAPRPGIQLAQATDASAPAPAGDRNAPQADPNRNAPPDGDAERNLLPPGSLQGAGEMVQPAVRPSTVNPPPPPAAAVPAPAPATPAVPPAANAAPRAPPRVAPGAPAAAANTAARRTPLPADAPAFNLSGGVFSQDPSRRMVIVNGQVFGQGSEPVTGVKVEEIRPNAAVVTFRGQRYTVAY